MNKVLLTIALAAGVTAGYAVDAATGWKLLGQQGSTYFVAVDPSVAKDPAVFRQAAAELCSAQTVCVAMFWDDARRAASKGPVNDAQNAALVARYIQNPASGQKELLLKCQAGVAQGKRCLK